jgi:hypothetical protein
MYVVKKRRMSPLQKRNEERKTKKMSNESYEGKVKADRIVAKKSRDM